MHWTDTLISDVGRREKERDKVRGALRNCGYSEWALKEGEQSGKKKLTTEEAPAQQVLDQGEGESNRQFAVLTLHERMDQITVVE